MKPSIIGCTLFTILSTTAAANLHRMSIARLDQGELPSIQESIQSTVQRFTSRDAVPKAKFNINNNKNPQGFVASRIDQRQHLLPFAEISKSSQRNGDNSDNNDNDEEIEDDDEEECDLSISSRRSPQIDIERFVLQHHRRGVAYVGQVGIGTPPQYFHLEFDLTSADTWIAQTGANCTNPNPCATKRRFFSPSRSSTFQLSPDLPWTTTATGISSGWDKKNVAKGRLRTDVVQVARFVVDRQLIGVADNVDGFREVGVDGVFGLGLHLLSAHGNATPAENLIAAGDMKSEIGIWLGSGNNGGEVSFGEADPLRYTGAITYIDLPLNAVYWSVPVRSILINRKPAPSPLPPPAPKTPPTDQQQPPAQPQPPPTQPSKPSPPPPIIQAARDPKKSKKPTQQPSIIFDTSSDLFLFPPTIAYRTHQYLHNFLFGWYSGYNYFTGVYTVPCSLSTDLYVDLGPAIPDTVGASGIAGGPPPLPGEEESKGQEKRWFRIAAQDIVRGRVPVLGMFGVCFSGVQASRGEDDDWVFGTHWFLGNYMVFDHLKRRVGIATSQRL